MTDDLVAFMHARLDEDAELARQAAEAGPIAQWDKDIDVTLGSELRLRRCLADVGVPGALAGAALAHAARHDPARVLADIDAKRSIVDAYALALDIVEATDYPDMINVGEESGLKTAVRALAAVYREHPGYRPEWAPDA